MRSAHELPPGQHAIDGFPRFGTHLHEPPPLVPADPGIEVGGAVTEPLSLSLADISALGRRQLSADFHCVSGWSATGLRWEGVPFETVYRTLIEPVVGPGASITHVVFEGLDGFSSYMRIEDALAEDVLIADRLDGRPLDADHGAPVRLVARSHYGFINTKHLCRIEICTSEPRDYGSASRAAGVGLRLLGYRRLPRARVWEEERHPFLPAWAIRLVGRVINPQIGLLSARGRRTGD
jgi:DMSO/TMAO reductase YedYZ molybdopterin-dependent catalytic subunit